MIRSLNTDTAATKVAPAHSTIEGLTRAFARIATGATAWTIAASAVFAGSTVGCGSYSEPQSEALPPTPEEELVSSGANVIACGASAEERQVYVIAAMNTKLRHFPEFAAYFGRDFVSSNCADARDLLRAYEGYGKEHPGFDANQPLEPDPDVPPLEDGPPPTAEGYKIQNGDVFGTIMPGSDAVAYPNLSIVRLTALAGLGVFLVRNDQCSGTFVAKNWVVTAAHCLSVIVGRKPMDAGFDFDAATPFAQEVFGYGRYQFDWAIADGTIDGGVSVKASVKSGGGPKCDLPPGPNLDRRQCAADVLQYPDPRWMGGKTDDFDFALLYLDPHRFDPHLPPRVDKGAAMRIALASLSPQKPVYVAGYGGEDVLRVGQVENVTTSDGSVYKHDVTSASEPIICKGDSGGPLFQFVNIGTATELNTVPVLIGVNGAFHSNRTPEPSCPIPGENEVWARAHLGPGASSPDELTFVENTMVHWNGGSTTINGVAVPHFSCKRNRSTGSATPDYLECWGDPCGGTLGPVCDVGDFCSGDGRDIKSGPCTVCGDSSACNCILGQCLHSP